MSSKKSASTAVAATDAVSAVPNVIPSTKSGKSAIPFPKKKKGASAEEKPVVTITPAEEVLAASVVEEKKVVVKEKAPRKKKAPAAVEEKSKSEQQQPLSDEIVPESDSEPSSNTTPLKKEEDNSEFKSILDTIIIMSRELRTLESRLRNVMKQHQKDIKEASKSAGRRKKQVSETTGGNNGSPSSNNTGIKKPVAISEALSDFLQLERGTLINRPDVTRRIFAYLREHNLQLPENKTIFNVDQALGAVLGEPIHLIRKDKPELGYGYSGTNLQTYLVPHFSNSAKKTKDAIEAALAAAQAKA